MMFAAVAGLLRTAALQRPLALMLDDLQWADRPTLLLLKYLLINPEPMPALVIATYRSTEISRAQPLAELLVELRREAGIEQIELEGLEPEACVAMAQDVAQESLDATGVEFVQALGEATKGNPFFLGEIVRSLKETGGVGHAAATGDFADRATLGVPPSVRDAIAARVAGMGDRAEQVLQAAAVIGREFDVELLARMLGVQEDQLVDVLDAADEAALITEVPGIGMRYSFVHPLIPPALYEQLPGGGRGACIAVRSTASSSCSARTRARSGAASSHTTRSRAYRSSQSAKAVDYARSAGQHALEQLAPQEATRWFEHALALHQSTGADGPAPTKTRCCVTC